MVSIGLTGNNIYSHSYNDCKNTTTWHFVNYNLILPNCLGFNIHNYVNKEIYVHQNTSIKPDFLSRAVFLSDRRYIGISFIVDKHDSNISYSGDFTKLNSNIELTKDNIIFYFYRQCNCKRISKLIIPLEIANRFDEINLKIKNIRNMIMKFITYKSSNTKTLTLNISNLLELNFTDIDSFAKRLHNSNNDEYMNLYNTYINILLSNI